MMLLPFLMIIGFGPHPNLLSISIMTDAADMIGKFHGNVLWQEVSLIIRLVLLINPDIDIISLFESVFVLEGLFPIGFGFVRGTYDYPNE